jgi:mono/diheme cytochrome c family protein
MQDALWARSVVAAVGLVLAALAAGPAGAAEAESVEPVVPGYYRLRDEAKDVNPSELGQLLIGELNCTQCHKADDAKRIEPKGAPDLAGIGARATPQWIRAYLSDPHGVKPGATMPDVFHASEPQAKAGAVEFLTHFLASLGGPMQPSAVEGTTVLAAQGKQLYHTVGCVACHAPEQGLADPKVPSVPHGDLAGKYTVESLTDFLLDPHKTRPAGRMPSLHLSVKDAQAIAIYLLRAQLENPQGGDDAPPLRSPGLKYELYDRTVFPNVDLATFGTVQPTSDGTVAVPTLDLPDRRSDNQFGVKFTGIIAIPRDGTYTFVTRSDDGSRLYVGGRQVVENEGIHPATDKSGTVDLKAGDHEFIVTYFEGDGEQELSVSWQGPDIPLQRIPADVLFKIGGRRMEPVGTHEPFRLDPQKVQMGARMFGVLGCANCHQVPGIQATRPAPALAQLQDPEGGCLAEEPAKGLPDYKLSEEQRAFIGEALADAASLAEPLEGEARVTRTMSALNCYACHRRGDVGGATDDRRDLFTMVKDFDMGDEGRLPPRLTGVGGKLKPEAMDQIIHEGKLHVRTHHMATRMPRFSKERMEGFVATVQALDDGGKNVAPPPPEFSETAVRDGRTLVGTKANGMGCTNCHGVAGVPSLGMPALDLSLTVERLKPRWFTELLLDPNGKNPGTRMPAFWFQGTVAYPDVAGGTAEGQIDAIWSYLSLGKSMGLPPGLQANGAGYELMPAGEPLIHRTFMTDVGPRAILVGSPDGLHVAFDANAVRLAKAWRGKFFDARAGRDARGGAFAGPLGTDVIDLPAGPSFAALAGPDAPWPAPKPGERNVGGRFRGYRTAPDGQPTFLYVFETVQVEETPRAVLRKDGAVLVRQFTLKGEDVSGLKFLAASGAKIEGGDGGVWTVDDKLKVRLDPRLKPVVRGGGGGGAKQLLVPVALTEGQATFDVEMSW